MEIKNIGALESPLLHDDRKPFKCWIRSQWRYAGLEALKLRKLRFSRARRTDRLRKLVMVMPVLIPLYILLVRGGVLDGWRGFRYAGERSLAEAMIGVRLLSSLFAASVG
jgi:hypothetical protein